MMRRRQFIAGSAALAFAGAARAQAEKVWQIAFLTPRARPSETEHDSFSRAFLQGMSELGYVEGKNLAVEWRYAAGDYAKLPNFARKLVSLNPTAIVTYGTAAARVLKETTSSIPIVVAAAVDLVGAGIVQSLARPGGNVTGLSVIDVDMSVKQLELLRTVLPQLARVAVLMNPGNAANPAVLKHVQDSGTAFGVEAFGVNAPTTEAIAPAIADAAEKGAGAMIVAADAFFSGQGAAIADASLQQRLATISLYQDHATAGCLMNYGQNVADFHRLAARYVDRIFHGARPEDLPVEQPTKLDLVINARTAAKLGLAIPQRLLMAADQVIE
jgi:putative tryptophan/tyrosine transport system substrate-binding protein